MRIAFVAVSLLLASATVLLARLIIQTLDFRKLVDQLNEEYTERRLLREVKRYTTAVSIKMSRVERFEFYFIDRSNIRRFVPFAGFPTLLMTSLTIFAATFQPVFKLLYFVPSTVIICLLIASAPLFALELMAVYNSEKIRRQLAEFLSVLNRWCAVKDDIFYAFEKSVDSGIGEPLRSFIKDMVIQVKCGIEPIDALDILQMKVGSEQFRDFLINIKQNIRSKGDTRKLLSNLEYQYYELEKEYVRRKISTYRDRLTIYVVMALVLVLGYFFITSSSKIQDFYLGTTPGKYLLSLFCVIYAIGAYLTSKIAKFKH
jgi:Flp pilus assembly protein TadB